MEVVKINSEALQLPKEICKNVTLFDEFFSLNTWNCLSPAIREHLTSNFLPDFCENNTKEKDKTINLLLSRKLKKFNMEALTKLHKHFSTKSRLKKNLKRLINKEQFRGYDECQRICRLFKNLKNSRKFFLKSSDKSLFNLSMNIPGSTFQNSSKIINTFDLDLSSLQYLNWFRESLMTYKNEKYNFQKDLKDLLEMPIETIFERTQLNIIKKRKRDSEKVIGPKIKNHLVKSARLNIVQKEYPTSKGNIELELDNKNYSFEKFDQDKYEKLNSTEPLLRNPFKTGLDPSKSDIISEKTTNTIDHSDVVTHTDNINIPSTSKIPELLQEVHACFLSLIRDILCSTPDHRISLNELKRKVSFWHQNPISQLNNWYEKSKDWLEMLPSAVYFLTGDFTDQPEDFVPYLEYKEHLNIYQWIGAGRDTDNNLVPLCNYWLSRKNDMGMKKTLKLCNLESSNELTDHRTLDKSKSLSSHWTVTTATHNEIQEFRVQEKKRYENPHKPFTYSHHGFKSVVGPVKGIYSQQIVGMPKARGHNMLAPNRPNYVTILTLVRDAAARLPNGEGTRAEICELLKSSQYINSSASDQVLQTIVSGALDRMHTESDPCVRYDAKRKIWIYLHRNRSEIEFEKMHLQQQCLDKPKKNICKKNKTKEDKLCSADFSSTKTELTEEQCLVSKPLVGVKNSLHQSIKKNLDITSNTMVQNQIKLSNLTNARKVVSDLSVKIFKKQNNNVNSSNVDSSIFQNMVVTNVQLPSSNKSNEQSSTKVMTKVTDSQKTENKLVVQNESSDLSKIGIIPQKFVQISPSRLSTNVNGNILTLNKSQSMVQIDKQKVRLQKDSVDIAKMSLPMSMTNYSSNMKPAKIFQVKSISGSISGLITTESLSPSNSNLQSKTQNQLPTSSNSKMVQSARMITVKNIQPVSNLNLVNKAELQTVKLQSTSGASPMPFIIKKTNDGTSNLNTNRQYVQNFNSSSFRSLISKTSDTSLKSKFLSQNNRSVMLTNKTKDNISIGQIIGSCNNVGSIKIDNNATPCTIKLQQLSSGTMEKNAKIINIQPNTENKIKTFSGIRMINASDLNITHINGKQVIIASKSLLSGQSSQNINVGGPSCRTSSNNIPKQHIPKGVVGQTTGQFAQHIILPKLQSGQLNLKTMQSVKIIPFSHQITGGL
uniref:CSON005634 protein n=1 Tax=Culicoides sonorensis TaxID=179676 RepID=A0A336LWB3_CULSO